MTIHVRLAVMALAIGMSACDVQVNEKGVSVDLAKGRASDEWSRTYALPAGGRLEIVNADGAIEAFPATGAQVEVRARRQVDSRSDEAAQQILKDLVIREDVSPDRVRVEVADTARLRGFRQNVRIDYQVDLPSGLNVSFETQNGPVRLENVEGRMTASSTNGGITARGLAGALQASTVNGGITVELGAVTGDVRLVTVNGGIRLDLPATVNADVEARTVNGRVVLADRLPLTATERGRLRVSGRLNAGGPTIELQTTNGSIRIGATGAAPP